MKRLAVAVAIAGVIALVTGVAQGSGGFLGVPFDLPLLSIGLAGLALAIVTLRARRISSFLRVFSAIFVVEYVLTSLAYVSARVEWWPTALTDAAPPASLPITLAVFALLISFPLSKWSVKSRASRTPISRPATGATSE